MIWQEPKFAILVGALISAFFAAPASADGDPEKAAVLAVVDEFFEAMTARDAATWERIMLPGAMAVTPLTDADGDPYIRYRSNAETVAGFGPEGPELVERYWDPTVLVNEPIAMFWAPYDFHIDGEFSHCGVDLFELVKVEGEWMLGNASWTIERENCPESPLGPLGE